MTIADDEDDDFLRIELRNRHPVELTDLASSLGSLGQAFEDFAMRHEQGPASGVRLYIRKLESGSIIAELMSLSDQASFILEHFDLFVGFTTNFNDLTRYFLNLPRKLDGEDGPTRREAQQVSQILEPVAKDNGSQLFLTVNGDLQINNYSSREANAVQNGVRRYLGETFPVVGSFHDELLYLHQVRAELHAQAGDRGVIERFSDRPVKLIFSNEDAKKAVLDRPFPFKEVFIVDGEVSTVGGKPGLYKIHYVKDVLERP